MENVEINLGHFYKFTKQYPVFTYCHCMVEICYQNSDINIHVCLEYCPISESSYTSKHWYYLSHDNDNKKKKKQSSDFFCQVGHKMGTVQTENDAPKMFPICFIPTE